ASRANGGLGRPHAEKRSSTPELGTAPRALVDRTSPSDRLRGGPLRLGAAEARSPFVGGAGGSTRPPRSGELREAARGRPGVEAAPGLLPELALLDFLFQHLRRREARPKLLLQRLGDRETHVEA